MSVNKVNSDGSLLRVAGGTLYADTPIGTITPFGGADAPAGWMICNGASLLRADYAELFAVIGTAFGSADSTHFNIPDMTGKTTMGVETDHALGASENGALPNITGRFVSMTSNSEAQPLFGDVGAVSITNQSSSSYTPRYSAANAVQNASRPVVVINASNSSALYKDDQTKVDPANVRVNYIIKAKMVALPADLASGVEEIINTENVLWENQSPNATFSAQDVTLSNGNYRYLTIYYKEYSGRNSYLSTKFPREVDFYLNKIDCGGGTNWYVYNRIGTWVNSTKLHFANAYQSTQELANNDHLIPIKIVGSMT